MPSLVVLEAEAEEGCFGNRSFQILGHPRVVGQVLLDVWCEARLLVLGFFQVSSTLDPKALLPCLHLKGTFQGDKTRLGPEAVGNDKDRPILKEGVLQERKL